MKYMDIFSKSITLNIRLSETSIGKDFFHSPRLLAFTNRDFKGYRYR